MKTILYATDYSNNSIAALQYAYGMSKQLKMRLVVTHVFDHSATTDAGIDTHFPDLKKNKYKQHRSRLEDFCSKHLEGPLQKMNIHIEAMENGSVSDGIISKATDWHAYLIVTGMTGNGALKEFIIGSTTKQLIEKSPCPILAIPENTAYRPIKNMVYATDFEEEDIYTVKSLTDIAKKFKANINIVHVSIKNEDMGKAQIDWFEEMLRDKVAYKKITFELIEGNDIFETLKTHLKDTNADMVVMMERKKNGFLKKWFHQDLVKKMESYGSIPLLSYNEANHQLLRF